MDARKNEPGVTKVEPKGERELVITRTFDAPARLVYDAWTKDELFKRWWLPKSTPMTMLSCEKDVRTGGHYRLEFSHPAFDKPMAFFGKYLEVVPGSRLVWTNEESEEGSVTTLTFEEKAGKTLLTMHELFPSKEARDASIGEMPEGLRETFGQLDELLVTLGTGG
jgi:uncharacterized protein YndB with AHSA1/START domain